MPLGRPHTHYLLKALRQCNRLEADEVIVCGKGEQELHWWIASLARSKELALPLASRLIFPRADESGTVAFYADASRELDEATGVAAPSSGWGLWFVIGDTFYYAHGRWSDWECRAFSINLLEAATQLFAVRAVFEAAATVGCECTHVHGFVDNSTAEMVMEKGRSQSDGLNFGNLRRVELLRSKGAFMKASRVASVDNDVADWLSRGDIEDEERGGIACLDERCRADRRDARNRRGRRRV